jgi:hypothetical protein
LAEENCFKIYVVCLFIMDISHNFVVLKLVLNGFMLNSCAGCVLCVAVQA